METNERYKIINGNSLEVLDTLAENSIDAIVTDPPYELGFMGKKWDSTGIAYNVELWKKAMRVLKPGGFLLAFGGTRTYHRIACAIEDAGFFIKDCIMWLYGSGFPKSMALDKSIEGKLTTGSANKTQFKNLSGELVDRGNYGYAKMQNEQGNRPADYNLIEEKRLDKLNPTTELAKKYSGWGTCLKPAYEPIIVAQKPTEGSITDNVIKYGVGGMNIDECRIGLKDNETKKGGFGQAKTGFQKGIGNSGDEDYKCEWKEDTSGRFPANVIHDGSEEATKDMPESKGASSQNNFSNGHIYRGQSLQESKTSLNGFREWYNDEGSAARYFYCAKASSKDRDEGLDKFVDKNIHPTVKPTTLMQYLIRLVTPKGGTVLDIFNGSGSTGKAVAYENKERDADYKYIGIELDPEYCEISKARIKYAEDATCIEPEVLTPEEIEVEEEQDSGYYDLF